MIETIWRDQEVSFQGNDSSLEPEGEYTWLKQNGEFVGRYIWVRIKAHCDAVSMLMSGEKESNADLGLDCSSACDDENIPQ